MLLKKNNLYILYITITKNNLKINLLDMKGKLILRKSEGSLKNIRKGSINSKDTSLIMMSYVSSILKNLNIPQLGIYVRGSTRWKKLSLRRLIGKLNNKIRIRFFRDITGIPHNGCSPKIKARNRKRRRLKIKRFKKFKIKEYHDWWHSTKSEEAQEIDFKKPVISVLSEKVDEITKSKQVGIKELNTYLKLKRYPKRLRLAKKNNKKKLKSTVVFNKLRSKTYKNIK